MPEATPSSAVSPPDAFLPGFEGLSEDERLLALAERSDRHTGAAVEADAVRLEMIRRLLALRVGKPRIARLARTSISTVVKIALKSEREIGAMQAELAGTTLAAAEALAERILNEVDQLPASSLGVTFGILIDKAQLLGGRATSIVERRGAERISDMGSLLDTLPRAQVVDVETGFATDSRSQMPASILPALEAADGHSLTPNQKVLAAQYEESRERVANRVATDDQEHAQDRAVDARGQGGGGGRAPTGGASTSN